MNKSQKVLTITSLAVVFIFVAGIFMAANMGGMVKRGIEYLASHTLGVDVSVASVNFELKEQRMEVGGLSIGNPQGFSKDGQAMTIGQIDITVKSMTDSFIHFTDIAVSDVDVNLEITRDGTNLGTIKNQMKRIPQPERSADTAELMKVIIDKVTIKQAQLNPSSTLIGDQKLEPVVMPDVILRDIGRKENGVLAREAIMQIWKGVTSSVNKSAGSAGMYTGMSPETMKEMGLTTTQKIKEQIKKSTEGLGSAIEGLF